MKIYAIWFGSYSDAYIDRVTASKEKAEEFCRFYNATHSYDSPYIAEYEVDDWEIEYGDNFDKTVGYAFCFSYSGIRLTSYTSIGEEAYRFVNEVKRDYCGNITVRVWCKDNDSEKAKKIAQDELMAWKYEHIDEL